MCVWLYATGRMTDDPSSIDAEYRIPIPTTRPIDLLKDGSNSYSYTLALPTTPPTARPYEYPQYRRSVRLITGWVRNQRTDAIRTTLISILTEAKTQRLEVVRGAL